MFHGRDIVLDMGTREVLLQYHLERMLAKAQVRGTCWVWTGGMSQGGYAMTTIAGRQTVAHRAIYELVKGAVPEGLVLDHLCRNRSCVNPDHLEPVTNAENVLRGRGVTAENRRRDTCLYGHPLSPRRDRHKRRYCRTCNREREARRRELRAAAGLPTNAYR